MVYEKALSKEGKSRFDFSREDLYENIMEFVVNNKSKMQNQLKKLGFALDWSQDIFTLDEKVIDTVYETFEKIYNDGLIYRGERLVNYCTKHNTGFSDLEINYVEKTTDLTCRCLTGGSQTIVLNESAIAFFVANLSCT